MESKEEELILKGGMGWNGDKGRDEERGRCRGGGGGGGEGGVEGSSYKSNMGRGRHVRCVCNQRLSRVNGGLE